MVEIRMDIVTGIGLVVAKWLGMNAPNDLLNAAISVALTAAYKRCWRCRDRQEPTPVPVSLGMSRASQHHCITLSTTLETKGTMRLLSVVGFDVGELVRRSFWDARGWGKREG